MLKTRLLPTVCVALLGAATPASALDVQVEVGVGGFAPTADGWTAVRVRCALSAEDPPFEGRVLLDRPSFAVSAYEAPLRIEPGGLVIAQLCVPAGAGKSFAVRIEDADGATVKTVEPTAPWRSIEAPERVAVVLGEGLNGLAGKGKNKIRVARVVPRDLPRDPRALKYVAAIFVPGDANAAIVDLCRDPKAVTTLREYVHNGGRLVFMSRPGTPPAWAGSAAEALLPVQGLALRSLPCSELEFLVGPLPTGDLSLLTGALRPSAHWKHQTDDVGLVAERRLGSGRVTFVAFDLEDTRIRNSKKIASFLSELAPRRGRSLFQLRQRRVKELAYETFQGRRPLSPLGFGLLAVAIVLHILVLGPLARFASKRRGTWAGLLLPPALSLALGALILLVAALARGEPEGRSLEFLVHTKSGVCETQLELALFAGPDTTFAVDLRNGWNPTLQKRSALDALTFRAPSPTLEFRDGKPSTLSPFVVPANGFTQLRVRSSGDSSETRAQLNPSPSDTTQLELRNLGTTPLTNLSLLSMADKAATWQLLPDLEAGKSLLLKPLTGPPIASGEEPPIDGDLFNPEDTPTLQVFNRRVALLLLRAYKRIHRKADSFPSRWAISIELDAEFPLILRSGEAELTDDRLRCVRVHMFPVGQ